MSDGGPAFPTEVYDGKCPHCQGTITGQRGTGMSLRDWLAGNRLVRLDNKREAKFAEGLMGPAPNWQEDPEGYLRWFSRYAAKVGYAYADAMLAERQRPIEFPADVDPGDAVAEAIEEEPAHG